MQKYIFNDFQNWYDTAKKAGYILQGGLRHFGGWWATLPSKEDGPKVGIWDPDDQKGYLYMKENKKDPVLKKIMNEALYMSEGGDNPEISHYAWKLGKSGLNHEDAFMAAAEEFGPETLELYITSFNRGHADGAYAFKFTSKSQAGGNRDLGDIVENINEVFMNYTDYEIPDERAMDAIIDYFDSLGYKEDVEYHKYAGYISVRYDIDSPELQKIFGSYGVSLDEAYSTETAKKYLYQVIANEEALYMAEGFSEGDYVVIDPAYGGGAAEVIEVHQTAVIVKHLNTGKTAIYSKSDVVQLDTAQDRWIEKASAMGQNPYPDDEDDY